MKKLIISIDGPAGAGKSTMAKKLARALDYDLLDTGALYRSIALLASRAGVSFDDEAGLRDIAENLDVRFELRGEHNAVFLAGEDCSAAIRTPEMSAGASMVSAHPQVRDALLGLQRRLGAAGGIVVEGRDAGTVVFPGAEAKFFLTASAAVRARRRCDELIAGGTPVDYDETLAEIEARDFRDQNREIAPLIPAVDAIIVDSSEMRPAEVLDSMVAEVRIRESAR